VRDHGVLVSDDLITWELSSYIPQRLEDDVFLHEGYLAPAQEPGSKDIVIVMRTARNSDYHVPLDPPRAFSSCSSDGGASWSEARAEMDLYNARSKAFFGQDARGNYVYVYSANFEREALHYKTKHPRRPWSEARVFYDNGGRNTYPNLREYEPGGFYATWDSSLKPGEYRSAIRFGRLVIEQES
jgi:hypothetical protein